MTRKVETVGEEATLAYGSVAGGAPTVGGRCGAIHIPPGVTVDHVRAEHAAAIDPFPSVSWRILECMEPNWTVPEKEVVRAVQFRGLKCENYAESVS